MWTVDAIVNFKICLQATSKVMGDRGKQGKREMQKSEYLKNENNFLDEIKNVFHSF